MDQNKADIIQDLLDLTTQHINEIVLDSDLQLLDAAIIFELAVQNALTEFQNNTRTKQSFLPIGRVDTTKLAFTLQDNETVVVLLGDEEFAETLELDYIGSEENELDEDED